MSTKTGIRLDFGVMGGLVHEINKQSSRKIVLTRLYEDDQVIGWTPLTIPTRDWSAFKRIGVKT
ncbi:MAG TPA: hypothetical protein PLO56_01360 [Rhodothermales bacterium]|nr:hypothetical protein [Rhodothermales bacterium]